jgi:hypothetical protein
MHIPLLVGSMLGLLGVLKARDAAAARGPIPDREDDDFAFTSDKFSGTLA